MPEHLVGLFADEKLIADEPIEERKAAAERALGLYLDEWIPRAGCIDPQVLEIGGLRPPAYVPLAEQLEALDRFERKRLNLVGAVLRSEEIGAHPLTWKLATCFAPMFELRGYLAEWITTQEAAVRAARATGDMYAHAWAELGLGHARWRHGMPSDALARFETTLEIARDQGWRRLEARALYMMGRVLHNSRELDQIRAALARYGRAFEIFQDEGIRQERVTLLFYCLKAVDQLGEVDKQVLARLVEGALQTLSREPEQIWVVRSVGWLKELMGLVHEDLSNLEQAGTYHVGSVNAFRRLGFRYGLARALRNLGRLRLQQGSRGHAAGGAGGERAAFTATGYRHEAGSSLILLGKALLDGQGTEAALNAGNRLSKSSRSCDPRKPKRCAP